MNPSNQEVQLRKTCQLYMYVLAEQKKEIPEEIQDCANFYEYSVDCVDKLYQALEGLDSETFKKIVNNPKSQESRDLANWWDMYQTYTPLSHT